MPGRVGAGHRAEAAPTAAGETLGQLGPFIAGWVDFMENTMVKQSSTHLLTFGKPLT